MWGSKNSHHPGPTLWGPPEALQNRKQRETAGEEPKQEEKGLQEEESEEKVEGDRERWIPQPWKIAMLLLRNTADEREIEKLREAKQRKCKATIKENVNNFGFIF